MTKKAFTLLELLLGLSIFSLVATGVYSTYFVGIRLSERAQSQNMVISEINWSLQALSHELESMTFYNFEKSYEDKQAFLGKDDEVAFLLKKDNELYRVRYYLDSSEYGSVVTTEIGKTYTKNVKVENKDVGQERTYNLMREQTLFRDFLSGGSSGAVQKEIISSHVKSQGLSLSYGYFQSKDDEDIIFKDQWGQSGIPMHVKLEVEFNWGQKDVNNTVLQKDILIPHGMYGIIEEG